ncbi:MAG: sigma-54 dependent transcriptional regulator [Gammaproteobacteria bacterium SHHR-1]|uniref:sigma-54-dependent transcriptional regulator n=1 Tax=Magnetovirga frankeli TaxID=947516 RepID=UPI00326A50D5
MSQAPAPPILLLAVDDLSLETLRRCLADEFQVFGAHDVREAESLLAVEPIQALLCDQQLPGEGAIAFLTRLREQRPDVVRMILLADSDPDDLIDSVNRAGIYQFITRPWQPNQLLLTLHNACELYRLQRENSLLAQEMRASASSLVEGQRQQRERLKHNYHLNSIVRAPGSPVETICSQVAQVAPFDICVLICGESGTGKELFARAIHYNSRRADHPFVAENCAAMPDQLLESELFGHKRGAFTGAVNDHIGLFEQADGGTIFLDEIGDVSPTFQVKLLRVLQEGEIRPVGGDQRYGVNVRVVAATNKNLEEEIRAGRFREDLFYRLGGVRLELPPLRERRTDIPLIARCLLQEAVRAFGKPCEGFTDEAMACLQDYPWPGNVRELRNEIQRLLVMSDNSADGGCWLEAALLHPRILCPSLSQDGKRGGARPGPEATLKERVEALEIRSLREALIRHRWNKTRAADELGLSRVGLRSKLERYGLDCWGGD